MTQPNRDGSGSCIIGTVRQLPSGKWRWHGLGRASRGDLPTMEAAQRAAKRSFGKVRFEAIEDIAVPDGRAAQKKGE